MSGELSGVIAMVIVFGCMRRRWRRAAAAARATRARGRCGHGRVCCGCAAGNVAVEFALAVPVLLLLMLGSAEMARFVILHQKMDRVGDHHLGPGVAGGDHQREPDRRHLRRPPAQVAEPFDLADLGVVIVSSVTNADGDGAGRSPGSAAAAASVRASASSASRATRPNLPAGFEVREGETAIISEVFYDFTPFLSELIVEPQVIYRSAHHRPRLGTLEEIDAG